MKNTPETLLENHRYIIGFYDRDIPKSIEKQDYRLVRAECIERRRKIDTYTNAYMRKYPKSLNLVVDEAYDILRAAYRIQRKMEKTIVDNANKILQQEDYS